MSTSLTRRWLADVGTIRARESKELRRQCSLLREQMERPVEGRVLTRLDSAARRVFAALLLIIASPMLGALLAALAAVFVSLFAGLLLLDLRNFARRPLPDRINEEDVGDALERLHELRLSGAPWWRRSSLMLVVVARTTLACAAFALARGEAVKGAAKED